MLTRIAVTEKNIEVAVTILMSAMSRRLAKHGTGALVSNHEALGLMTEEYLELIDAVKSNDTEQVTNEALDCAIVGLWTVASMVAGSEAAALKKKADKAVAEITGDGVEKVPFTL